MKGSLRRLLCVLFIVSVIAACEEESAVSVVSETSPLVGVDTYLYLTCSATGWELNDNTRLESTGAPELFKLTYGVSESWMTTGFDNCALIETNELNGWGTEQTYYELRNMTQLIAPDGAQLQTMSYYTQFQIQYETIGIYTAQVNMARGILSIQQELSLDNFTPYEAVDYEMVLLRGKVSSGVDFANVSNNGEPERSWDTANGRFKALVQLTQGSNVISVRLDDGTPMNLPLQFIPRYEDKHVRVVYLTASDSNGDFQAVIPGEPNDIETAKDRIRFNALIIQSTIAEMMYDAGRGRKTVQFLEDESGDIVHVEKLNLNTSQIQDYRIVCELDSAGDPVCEDGPAGYYNLYDFYYKVNDVMRATSDYDSTKALVYIGATEYTRTPTSSLLVAGPTLGGPNTATVQGNSLYAFPENLDELQVRMYDSRLESMYNMHPLGWDPAELWKVWSISLGGATHELIHCLGVMEHSTEYFSIMGGGFYHFWRMYMTEDGDGTPYVDNEVPFIAEFGDNGFASLDFLDQSAWMN